jgi:DUF4097 and DUF4098 domain-containing protein YvlB
MDTRLHTLARHAALSTIILSAGYVSGAYAEEYSKAYSLTGPADVRVHADNGSVRVTTSETSQVEFHVSYDKSDWESSAAPQIDSRQSGKVVELTALIPGPGLRWFGFGKRRLSIEVRMPAKGDLSIDTSNGAIDVSYLSGNIVLRSSNGAIRAAQLAGTVDIGSTNGRLELNAVKGTLKAVTSNGAITAIGLDGKCDVETQNGGVDVAGRFDSLAIHTQNGAVTARAESGSGLSSVWDISTTNNSVNLSVPRDLKANLDAGATNGHIELDLPVTVQGYQSRTQIRGALNGGGPEMSVHTTNGGIHLSGI